MISRNGPINKPISAQYMNKLLSKIYSSLSITTIALGFMVINSATTHASVMDWVKGDNNTAKLQDSLDFALSYIKPNDQNQTDDSTVVVNQKAPKVIRKYKVTITAYSSDPRQTDDSPLITASMTHVRDGIIAVNFLPFKTTVQLPKLFGNKIFVAEDRMNSRYNYDNSGEYRIDIWVSNADIARQFGIRHNVEMIVVEV